MVSKQITAEQAVEIIARWHSEGVETLKEITNRNKDKPFVLRFPNEKGELEELTLNEQQAAGFNLGIHTAMEMLGTLPINISVETEEAIDD